MRRPAALVWLMIGCGVVLLGREPTAAAQTSSLIDLGTNVVANGINASGQVTGCAPAAGGATHAFIYNAGVSTDLGTLGGSSSCGFAINASGKVTGYAATVAGTPHAFLYSSGSMKDLGTLPATNWPGSTNPPDSMGLAIDDAGNVAGASSGGGDLALSTDFYGWMMSADDDPLSPPIGFLYSGGAMISVLMQPGHYVATGINESGTVIGTQIAGRCETLCPQAAAFLLSNGTTTYITSVGNVGLFFSVLTGINAGGQVAGYGESSDAHMHAFLFSDGNVADLGPDKDAFAINSTGQVVGLSKVGLNNTVGPTSEAFLYSGGTSTSLNIPGAVPSGINDSGWIIANDSTLHHAYLLRPSPVSLTPTGLSFSNVPAGVVSAAQAVTLSNGTGSALAVGPIAVAAPFAQTNNCPASLDAGAFCVIKVTFTSGSATNLGAVSVPAGGTTYVTLLSGLGTIPVSITASSTTATVGKSFTLSWTASIGSAGLCTATGGSAMDSWRGDLPGFGDQAVTESAPGSYTYTLSCDSSTATGTGSVSVKVNTVPTLPPTPTPMSGGGSVDLLMLAMLSFVLAATRLGRVNHDACHASGERESRPSARSWERV